ncbi:MAG: antibiotic biosynthesis monooxygenase [Chloroflexi bacterium]|jgi:autoinducer 2-degrading protein|nr:antibiotic biosynthesis monooxygenase [Chloroflexota bacterium]
MYIVLVNVHVKQEFVDQFKSATIENARHSNLEDGIARFDFIQENDDPTRFVLIEVYKNVAAAAAHKETQHYLTWRDRVAEMMAEARTSAKYTNIFPDDAGWE